MLVNLQCLDLSGNKLRSLPAELGELVYLRFVLIFILDNISLFTELCKEKPVVGI